MCAAPAAGARPWKKNSRGDRRHRSGLAARCRRRSHHRYPLDPPHHREDRNRTRHPRHPGLSQDRRPHPQGPRLPAARQPQARLGRLRPRPRPAVQYIAEQHAQFAQRGLPIVSIDTKKRELIGNFKNQGTTGNDLHKPSTTTTSAPRPTASPSPTASTTCAPIAASNGRRHRPTITPDFAADNLVRWWQRDGLERYRDASELLVLADSGGSNAPRMPLLQVCTPDAHSPTRHHLKVTVCHYPSGASKWNPIDHRLFSELFSKNWAGHPLRSYQTILNHIRTTTTDTGVVALTAQLVDQEYSRRASKYPTLKVRFHRPSTSSGHKRVAQLRPSVPSVLNEDKTGICSNAPALTDFDVLLRDKCWVRQVTFDGPDDFFHESILAQVERTWEQWLGPLVPGATLLRDRHPVAETAGDGFGRIGRSHVNAPTPVSSPGSAALSRFAAAAVVLVAALAATSCSTTPQVARRGSCELGRRATGNRGGPRRGQRPCRTRHRRPRHRRRDHRTVGGRSQRPRRPGDRGGDR